VSIRPSASAVDLTLFRSVIGSRDDHVRNEWHQVLPSCFSDPRVATYAKNLVNWLVDRPADALTPRVETEPMAITVNAFFPPRARQCDPQATIFFEALFAGICAPKSRIEWFADYRRIFRLGRPLVAPEFDSGWSYYSYLNRDELPRFIELLEEDERITSFFDSRAGIDFLKSVQRENLDLWVFFS
jgi:hypothetical protein